MIDLVEDPEGGREADRMQEDAQEQYRIEGCFLPYGDPSYMAILRRREALPCRAQPGKTLNPGSSALVV
jgi:hypothetical protein